MAEPISVMRARYECQCCGRNLTVTESYRGTDKNDDPDGYYYVFDEAPDIRRWITSSAAAVRFKKIKETPPWAIVDTDVANGKRYNVVVKFYTLQEAEAWIAARAKIDPESVHRGRYGIDGPEN